MPKCCRGNALLADLGDCSHGICGCCCCGGDRAVPSGCPVGKTTEQTEKLTDRIELAVYGELPLQADKTEQALGFSNPSRNFCYIQPSLWLADGTLLWRGLLIVPDDVGNMVMLSQPLPEGTHTSARLRYDCFTIEKNGVQ